MVPPLPVSAAVLYPARGGRKAGVSSKANRRKPLSARVCGAAASVIADAAELMPHVSWAFARLDGEKLLVVCVADENPSVGIGEVLDPDDEKDIVVPLVYPEGPAFGALCGLGGAQDVGNPAATARVERWADILVAIASAEREAETQAERAAESDDRARRVEVEALTDALTGVANRRAWDRALEAEESRRRRYGGPAAVVVVDLDELKQINDTQGHLHGDLLLRLVARIIQDTSRESDVVARTGGDEFAVLALDCEEPQLRILLSRLRDALEREGVSASVGGACRRLSAGMAEAWAEADDVMFEEKNRRKG